MDYTLEQQTDGSWAPKASTVDVQNDGGSAKEAARVAFEDGKSLAVAWPQSLPEPTIDGGVATYKRSAAADLLVAVTGSGVTTLAGVTVEFAKEQLIFKPGTSDPYTEFQMHILGAVAQLERSIIRERQAEGIAKAKARGVHKGRKSALTADQIVEARERIAAGVPKVVVARDLGVSRPNPLHRDRGTVGHVRVARAGYEKRSSTGRSEALHSTRLTQQFHPSKTPLAVRLASKG